jgi:hypothetical protein
MQSQKLALILASVFTGAFLAVVGVVVAWQVLDRPQQDGPAAPGKFIQDIAVAPLQNFAPIEGEMPVAPAVPVNEAVEPMKPAPRAKDLTVSGPHAHGNLAIFLIHGEDQLENSKIVTLQEALEQNTAIVHDRGNLVIENRGNAPLFIQSGDIVKGGNQDRGLPYDMLLSARTSSGPVNAFCVEAGRSHPRGNEVSSSFQVATEQLPGRALKLAMHQPNNAQAAVWTGVSNVQTNLSRNVGDVRARQSTTSLQLTIEHPHVQRAIEGTLANLAPVTQDKDNVIGYAVAVNGKIHSADVYASSALFLKAWPKLIRASAVEAIAERREGANVAAPTSEAVEAFLTDAEKGNRSRVQSNGLGVIQRRESAQHLTHEMFAPTQQSLLLHRSVLAR